MSDWIWRKVDGRPRSLSSEVYCVHFWGNQSYLLGLKGNLWAPKNVSGNMSVQLLRNLHIEQEGHHHVLWVCRGIPQGVGKGRNIISILYMNKEGNEPNCHRFPSTLEIAGFTKNLAHEFTSTKTDKHVAPICLKDLFKPQIEIPNDQVKMGILDLLISPYNTIYIHISTFIPSK